MATVLAGPAYRLLGKKDLGTPGDYLTDKMPAVNKLIGGELAWRQHDGGHTQCPEFSGVLRVGPVVTSPRPGAGQEEVTGTSGMRAEKRSTGAGPKWLRIPRFWCE